MTPKTRNILVIAGIVIIIGIIGNIVSPEQTVASTEVTASSTPEENNSAIDRTKAYVIAKQFAEGHIGKADFGFGDDGFEDFGNGNYYVTGVADVPGKRIRWTVELQYNGGEWNERSNWTEKGFVAN